MIDFTTTDLDTMVRDIIDIFTNVEGVKLVRLSGLFVREQRISNYKNLTPELLDNIIHKLKNAHVIDYQYVLYCPNCFEVTYQVEHTENPYKAKVCDTCGQIYIPTKEVSLFEYED